MLERYGVCETVVLQGDLARDIELAARTGAAGIGIDPEALAAVGADQAARLLEAAGLRATSLMDIAEILSRPVDLAAIDGARRGLDDAATLRAPGALVFSGPLGDIDTQQADDQCRQWLDAAAPLAADRGTRIMLEPMHPLLRKWSYIHTLEHALALTAPYAPHAGVVFDVGHLWWQPDLVATAQRHVDAIVSVQLTDIDSNALDDLRYERAPFGTGAVDVAAFVSALEAAGYRGYYENEVLISMPRNDRARFLEESAAWFGALEPPRA